MKLPWLLDAEAQRTDEWLPLLFGEGVPHQANMAAWEAYLLYARFYSETALILRSRYEVALDALTSDEDRNALAGRDPVEQLGIHVGVAYLRNLAPGRDWITRYYRGASDQDRSYVTRWLGEQTAIEDAPDSIATLARGFLAQRVSEAKAETDPHELRANGWAAAAADHKDDVLTDILLPTLEKTGGRIDNEEACITFVGSLASDLPAQAARALQLLIEGDEWRVLPRLAAVEIREGLERLLATHDSRAREIASDVVHTLGARGFLDYRDLVSPSD
jgi:hypothetical protein